MSGSAAGSRTVDGMVATGGIVLGVPHGSASAPDQVDHSLSAGMSALATLLVGEEDTSVALGSGDVRVVGTPRLVALCEDASCRVVGDRLGPARTSVASRIQFDHLAPVGVGQTVVAEATLERVEGRRLVFAVIVRRTSEAPTDLVGAGRLRRVVVDRAKFMERAGGPAPG